MLLRNMEIFGPGRFRMQGIESYLGIFWDSIFHTVTVLPFAVLSLGAVESLISNSSTSRIGHRWEAFEPNRFSFRSLLQLQFSSSSSDDDIKHFGAEPLKESYQSGFSRRRTTAYLWTGSLVVTFYQSTPVALWIPWQQTCF